MDWLLLSYWIPLPFQALMNHINMTEFSFLPFFPVFFPTCVSLDEKVESFAFAVEQQPAESLLLLWKETFELDKLAS